MSSWDHFLVPIAIFILSFILTGIICRDASNLMRTSDTIPKNNAWNIPNNGAAVWAGKTTTPWPALGGNRYKVEHHISLSPSWVRPSTERTSNNFRNQTSGSLLGPQTDVNNNALSNSPSFLNEDDELREFAESLLKKDTNNAAKYVTANYQGRTTSRSQRDEAPQPLLTIDKEAYAIPTIEKMMLLYNNYILESNQNEQYTAQEKTEENNLLDAVMETGVMRHARSFLIEKGKIGKDPKAFKDVLREIWFNMYSRGGGRVGSSGFEHVFLAEIKNQQISGLHNWIYFNEEERKNEANYLGYMKKIDLGNKGAILKYHFKFHNIDKPVGSMFIGTSPELEMALYTTCFLMRADQICPLKLNNNRFIIRTYTYRYRGKNMIGSAFPEI